MPTLARVVVEIDVRVERCTTPILVGPAPKMEWVVEQLVDVCQAAQQLKKRGRLNGPIERREGRTQRVHWPKCRLGARLAVVPDKVPSFKRRELVQEVQCHLVVEKLVNYDMRKWLACGKPCSYFSRPLANGGIERIQRRRGVRCMASCRLGHNDLHSSIAPCFPSAK